MKIAGFLSALASATLLLTSAATVRAGAADGKLDVYFIDTEGGASTLIVTPAGESLLVDTGNPGTRDPNRIATAAKDAGITKIDFLVITHYHTDHFGGLAELAKLLPIGTLYDNADQQASTEKPSAAYLAAKVDKRLLIKPGDILPLKQAEKIPATSAPVSTAAATTTAAPPKLTIQCLAAHHKFIDGAAKEARDAGPNPFAATARAKPIDTSDNISSVVQLLSFGNFRFYDGGDLTWNAEAELVAPLNRVGTVNVYQVTHHGLNLSNNPILVKALTPTVAIMNNGPTKGCEAETVTTLRAVTSIKDIWQLHKNLGANADKLNTAPDLIANSTAEKDCKGEYIKLSVASDGKEYTVSIPSTKMGKTYQTLNR